MSVIKSRLGAVLAAVCVTVTVGIGGAAEASINTSGCISGQEGCVKFNLWENTSIHKEYSYIVPAYPQSQYLRNDNLWANVEYVRNRTRPYFMTFGSSGYPGSGCEARIQDSNGYVYNFNIAMFAADATALPFGCSAF